MLAVQPLKREDYRVWPFVAQGLPELRVHVDAARDLAARVLDGVKALPRRGLEIGGLLIGRKDGDTIYVDSILPLNSDYPSGPTFLVTEEAVVAAVDQADTVGQIVGLYRSRTDGVLDIDTQSEFMLRAVPQSDVAVFFVIRQTRNTPAEARAGVRTASGFQWSGEPTLLQDWISGARELSEQSRDHRADPIGIAAAPTVIRAEPVANSVPEPAAVRTAAPASNRVKRWGMMAACFAAGGCMALLLTRASQPVAPGVRSFVPIAPVRDAGMDETSVRNRTASSSTEPPSAPVSAVSVSSTPKRLLPVPEPDSIPPRRDDTPRVAPVQLAASALASPKPPIVERHGTPPDMTPLPVLKPPVVAQTSPSVAAAPAPSIATGTAALAPAPQATPAGGTVQFIPPMLARQRRQIVVPPDLRRLLDHEIVLAAKVSVDDRGRVLGVVPLHSLGRVEESIWRAYAAGIAGWEFDSAMQNGKPVAGEAILRFRVQPAR